MADPKEIWDVYATPYVPQKLLDVNKATFPTIVPSLPAPDVDFSAYIQTFTGTLLLPPLQQQLPVPSPPAEPQALCVENYSQYFRNAVTHEIDAVTGECEDHSLYRVPLTPMYERPWVASSFHMQPMYQLQVPGLRESSLRIEVGDIVYIRQLRYDLQDEIIVGRRTHDDRGQPIPVSGQDDLRHDAVVRSINRKDEILTLRIDNLFPGSWQFNVCFTPQFPRLHTLQLVVQNVRERLSTNSWVRSMLFPEYEDGTMQHSLNSRNTDFEAQDRELNHEQLRAIDNVLKRNYGHVPFLITGPPGTGKTKTVVEITLQLITSIKSTRLILCAPSDAAADMLVQRLGKHITPGELLRLNAAGRAFAEVPDHVLPFCMIEGEIFSLPPFSELMQKRVVVTTCRDAEILSTARVTNIDLYTIEHNLYSLLHPDEPPRKPAIHWTGLIIDEAAQAMEPEALIPMNVVLPSDYLVQEDHTLPFVIMVGDHHQLGPRTAYKDETIQCSYFERLLSRSIYSDHPLARSKQTSGTIRPLSKDMLPLIRPAFADLIRNYRSHPAILAVPSSLFYHDTLEPCAQNTDSLLHWKQFTGGEVLILFSNNRSHDEIERDGGGWFNMGEVSQALRYAQSLLLENLVKPEDICIMSPFSAQVKKLRQKARGLRLYQINIGPLEAFQGLSPEWSSCVRLAHVTASSTQTSSVAWASSTSRDGSTLP